MRRHPDMERTAGGALIDNVLMFVVPAAAPEIGRVRRAVGEFLTLRGAPSVVVEDLQLVASELATNAVMYGIGTTIEVSVEMREAIRLSVSNHGDAALIPPVDDWGPAPATAVSGRGLGIVRRLADEVAVHDGDGRTTVEVWRRLPDGAPDWAV